MQNLWIFDCDMDREQIIYNTDHHFTLLTNPVATADKSTAGEMTESVTGL